MKLTMGLAILAALGAVPAYAAPTLTTIANFTGTNGNDPSAALIADASGNLFGTTYIGGTANLGTVFEIPRMGGGYGALSVIATFTGTANGANPQSGLTADASGNLFGTTAGGGATCAGTVFEIPKTGGSYGTLATLSYFDGTNGSALDGGVTVDASGNLLGTTDGGGANGKGTVFEIAKTGGTYGAPTTIATFNGTANGANPLGGLTADASGNLFGTTSGGGATGLGTVFEIPRSGGAYGTLTTLATFTGFNGTTLGADPYAGLIADASGNLFGTTFTGGNSNSGEVFEIAKTGGAYAALRTIANIGSNGQPIGGLTADASGNLFGTTHIAGTAGDGTVFEITGSGFQTAVNAPEPASMLTLGAGTAVLAIVRRRRCQKSRAVDGQA